MSQTFAGAQPHPLHYRRIRRRARLVSWAAVPLLYLALGVWWLFTVAACVGGSPGPRVTPLCRNFHWLPDVMIALIAVSALALLSALNWYAEDAFGRTRAPHASFVLHVAGNARHAYGRLDAAHRAHVRFAVEMIGWSLAAVIATLVTALTYFDIGGVNLFGFLLVAAALRLLFALYRRIRMTLHPPAAPPTVPTT
ncbi:MAG TPA: hypothetical protein VEI03_15610 [Stellaceae bacterium]|nr:hypothetical protein [Stellaceae bacterium]